MNVRWLSLVACVAVSPAVAHESVDLAGSAERVARAAREIRGAVATLNTLDLTTGHHAGAGIDPGIVHHVDAGIDPGIIVPVQPDGALAEVLPGMLPNGKLVLPRTDALGGLNLDELTRALPNLDSLNIDLQQLRRLNPLQRIIPHLPGPRSK